jgi:hypothetical protein
MKTPILIMLALISIQAGGQNHFIGIKGGSSWTNNTTNHFTQYASYTNPDKKFRVGFSGGITYDYILNKNFSLGVDLLYDQRGFINSADFKDADANLFNSWQLSISDYLIHAVTVDGFLLKI